MSCFSRLGLCSSIVVVLCNESMVRGLATHTSLSDLSVVSSLFPSFRWDWRAWVFHFESVLLDVFISFFFQTSGFILLPIFLIFITFFRFMVLERFFKNNKYIFLEIIIYYFIMENRMWHNYHRTIRESSFQNYVDNLNVSNIKSINFNWLLR